MIDRHGFRPNVGIILCNDAGKVFWARRSGENAWQFPQGGIQNNETPEQALFRELEEEVGLTARHVEIIGRTADWLRYRIPKRFLRYNNRQRPRCIGQKQVWYLLRFTGRDSCVSLDRSAKPEFDSWRWVDYRDTVDQVVSFKRSVYCKALSELIPLIIPGGVIEFPDQLAGEAG